MPDPDAQRYFDLMDCILAARDQQTLLLLVKDVLACTGGIVRLDFGEAWYAQWRRVAGDQPVPDGFWPR